MAERQPGEEFESRGVNGHLYWRIVTEYQYADGTFRTDVRGHSENCKCHEMPWEFDPEGDW